MLCIINRPYLSLLASFPLYLFFRLKSKHTIIKYRNVYFSCLLYRTFYKARLSF